jgi:hypothetical protein
LQFHIITTSLQPKLLYRTSRKKKIISSSVDANKWVMFQTSSKHQWCSHTVLCVCTDEVCSNLGTTQNISFLWVPRKGKLTEWTPVMSLQSWSEFYVRVTTNYLTTAWPRLRVNYRNGHHQCSNRERVCPTQTLHKKNATSVNQVRENCWKEH